MGQISKGWIRMVFKSVPSTRLSFASWKQLSSYSSGFLAFSNTWCKPNTWGCLMNEWILYFKQQAFLLGLLFHVLVWIFHWDKSPHQKKNLCVRVWDRFTYAHTHTGNKLYLETDLINRSRTFTEYHIRFFSILILWPKIYNNYLVDMNFLELREILQKELEILALCRSILGTDC